VVPGLPVRLPDVIQPVGPEEGPGAGFRLRAMEALHLGVRDLPTAVQIPKTSHDTVLSHGSTTLSGASPQARMSAAILSPLWTIVQRMWNPAEDRVTEAWP
jgi:hypothetical protein